MEIGRLAALPRWAWAILREASRHILRHPVVGVVAAARTADDRWLLVRRADTGTWAPPGGTLEWGETLRQGLVREVEEETGARVSKVGRVVGVYSRPDRDPRFHAVTIAVEVEVEVRVEAGAEAGANAEATSAAMLRPANPLEIREVKLFPRAELPPSLAFGTGDILRDALTGTGQTILE